MEAFFRTHTYLVEHTHVAVRRTLMDEIDWRGRLIGIKGTRGVGKTTFLLEIAKERFDARDRRCLYINMNNFYFQGRGIHDFRTKVVNGYKSCIVCAENKIFAQLDTHKHINNIGGTDGMAIAMCLLSEGIATHAGLPWELSGIQMNVCLLYTSDAADE